MNLDTRTKKITMIISLKDIPDYKFRDYDILLKTWLNDNASIFAFILHNCDMNDDGVFKTPHYHLVFDLKKVTRLATLINKISNFLKISPFAISIDKYTDFTSCVKYLIHKDNPEKCQYSIEKIISNLDYDELDTYMNSNSVRIDYDYLCSCVTQCNNKSELIKMLGVSLYERHFKAIDIIWSDIKRT